MTELKDRFAELPAARQKLLLRRLKEKRQRQSDRLPTSAKRQSGEPFPLSASQERLWFLEQLTPGTAAYNIPNALRLTGELDTPTFEAALRAMVRRHESLRTIFPASDDQAEQKILPQVEIDLPVIDLSRLDEAASEPLARRLIHQVAGRAFDIAHGPLLSAGLIRLEEREHQLILVIHHIVADGWSLGILQRDLAKTYATLRGDTADSTLPELPIQYPDFADWQKAWLEGDGPKEQIEHWRQQLEGVPILELTPDRPRPRVQTFRGDSRWVELPAALVTRLRDLGQQEAAASLFMVLLAGFKAVLYRYTGQDDLAIGTFIAGRNRPETENLIGFFVNNLTLRTRLDGRSGFRQLLRSVRRTTLDAYAHQDIPFEKLLEILQPERDMSRPSLFQIMCVLQNTPAGDGAFPGLEAETVHLDGGQSNFDLTVWFHEVGDEVRGQLQFNADLYDASTIERFAGHLARLF
ncbi:MAG: condensation domain-containing protein, partial [Acidobacteriota bacterium]